MIKVTYEQNTNLLIARKVTSGGGVNATIPVGEISFQADLSPSCYSIDENAGECLLPLDDLPQELIKRWDERKLVRFPGKGQIADPGFQNCEWVRGELVLVDMNDFIFVWEDLGFQIFFSRPPKYLWDGARETNEEELGGYPGYFYMFSCSTLFIFKCIIALFSKRYSRNTGTQLVYILIKMLF